MQPPGVGRADGSCLITGAPLDITAGGATSNYSSQSVGRETYLYDEDNQSEPKGPISARESMGQPHTSGQSYPRDLSLIYIIWVLTGPSMDPLCAPGMGGIEYPSPYATTRRKKRLYWLCL
jgi:hypothetical protein